MPYNFANDAFHSHGFFRNRRTGKPEIVLDEIKHILDFEFSSQALITDGLFWLGDVGCLSVFGFLTSISCLLSGLTSKRGVGNGRGSDLDTGGGGRGRPGLFGGTSTILKHQHYLYHRHTDLALIGIT